MIVFMDLWIIILGRSEIGFIDGQGFLPKYFAETQAADVHFPRIYVGLIVMRVKCDAGFSRFVRE